MRWLIRTNLAIFLLVFVVSILPTETTAVGRIVRSLVELAAVLVLPGLNLVALLQYTLKRSFSLLETLSLSAAASLFLVPLLLTLEFTKFSILFPRLPLVNSLLIFTATAGIFFLVSFVHNNPDAFPEFALNSRSIRRYVFSRAFLFPIILYSAVAGSITTAFYPLPDLDPYYWYDEYQKLFQTHTLATITEYRPLFSSLAYIFTYGAEVDFYAFFKYVLPFAFLLLVFPLALLASRFEHPLHRAIIFLFPFASGIIIIYLTLPIPQAIANIASLFAAALITYSWIRKDVFLFLVGGAILFLGYFSHEAMALPFVIWLIASVITFRREFFVIARANKLSTLLLAILLLPSLAEPANFVVSKIERYLSNLHKLQTNFLFPEYYVNIDGNEMGWGNLIGVAKYYLFYVGPALLLLFIAVLIGRKLIHPKESLLSRYASPLTLSFLAFLIIAEVLPRLANIAFLPDRAWVFAGAFAIVFLPVIFSTPLGHRKAFLWLIILGFSLNIGAALYINHLKKYLITEPQLASARWINTNLPKDRVIFTVDNHRLLRFYSNSEVVQVQNPNFYYDPAVFETELNTKQKTEEKEHLLRLYHKEAKNFEGILQQIRELDPEKSTAAAEALLASGSASLSSAQSLLAKLKDIASQKPLRHLYIYYAAPDPRNPYLDRPYMKSITGKESKLIFDRNPSHFKKIYSDEDHRIYIWKIL